MRWTVVIPAKALPEAKSRLVPASADAVAHQRLVAAIRCDTATAAHHAPGVARVLVVADRQDDETRPRDEVLVQRAPGLNAALQEAAEHANRNWPADGVAALVGDLPALRPEELAAALSLAAVHHRAYVPDAAGTGTTLLAALPGIALAPAFGADSAASHAASGAAALPAGPGLRADVDTAADLAVAAELHLGSATSTALREAAFVGSLH